MRELRQLAVERKVTRARALAHQKRLPPQMGVKQIHQAQVAGLNHFGGLFIRAHYRQACNLALREIRFGGIKHRLVRAHTHKVLRKDVACLVNAFGKLPAVVEHGLGQPFVGKVFQQGVYKIEHRVGRQRAAPGHFVFQAAHQRRGIGHRFECAIGIGQIKRWQQLDCRLGHARLVCRRAHQIAVGNVAVAHQRHHLAGVGRARRALEGHGQRDHVQASNAAVSSAKSAATDRRTVIRLTSGLTGKITVCSIAAHLCTSSPVAPMAIAKLKKSRWLR